MTFSFITATISRRSSPAARVLISATLHDPSSRCQEQSREVQGQISVFHPFYFARSHLGLSHPVNSGVFLAPSFCGVAGCGLGFAHVARLSTASIEPGQVAHRHCVYCRRVSEHHKTTRTETYLARPESGADIYEHSVPLQSRIKRYRKGLCTRVGPLGALARCPDNEDPRVVPTSRGTSSTQYGRSPVFAVCLSDGLEPSVHDECLLGTRDENCGMRQ
jgi:hypothetical protein